MLVDVGALKARCIIITFQVLTDFLKPDVCFAIADLEDEPFG
ncbi:MAG: hypothetical protein AAFO59_11680 [Cyanobacteria bacterium J06607_17]